MSPTFEDMLMRKIKDVVVKYANSDVQCSCSAAVAVDGGDDLGMVFVHRRQNQKIEGQLLI